MIDRLNIRYFKSIESVEFEPGCVNVFIGANGSGKSNLLEAIGILSAAASGRVDDESVQRRGVRRGPLNCIFRDLKEESDIILEAQASSSVYTVSLFNPSADQFPLWHYRHETLKVGDNIVIERSDHMPEYGLAALKAAELAPESIGLSFLDALRKFVIYTPDTHTLRGTVNDINRAMPIGLSGGQLANALSYLEKLQEEKNTFVESVHQEVLHLIDWATGFKTIPSAFSRPTFVLSPESFSKMQVWFSDRFMKEGQNSLAGFEVSEGALYALFHAALAAHPQTPPICAVDNADHSLNPRLARNLFKHICQWYLNSPRPRQIFLTTQNPLTLDGLPLQNDAIRLFTVDRTETGRTVLRRILLDEKMKEMADKGWTLSRLWVMGHIGGVPNV